MQLSDFLGLSIGSVIYNKKTKDIRRTLTQFYPDRLDQYKGSGAAMWTRPVFNEEGFGLDILLDDCGDWEPLPLNVWEIDDQTIINRYLTEQQSQIFNLLSRLRQVVRF